MQFYLKYLQVHTKDPVLFLVSPKNFSPFFKTPSQAFAIHFHSPHPFHQKPPRTIAITKFTSPRIRVFSGPRFSESSNLGSVLGIMTPCVWCIYRHMGSIKMSDTPKSQYWEGGIPMPQT